MDLFFSYFREQWGPSSHVCNWYEGAHPYHVGNNQGIESRNLAVKDDFSYRDQLNMTQFVAMMEKITNHYSTIDVMLVYYINQGQVVY